MSTQSRAAREAAAVSDKRAAESLAAVQELVAQTRLPDLQAFEMESIEVGVRRIRVQNNTNTAIEVLGAEPAPVGHGRIDPPARWPLTIDPKGSQTLDLVEVAFLEIHTHVQLRLHSGHVRLVAIQ